MKLATDPDYRQSSAARIMERMGQGPIFVDTLAASEAFGDLIETAYDELATVGQSKFRGNPTPVRTTMSADVEQIALMDPAAAARQVLRRSPADPAARHTIGRELLAAGRSQRAATYLLGALQGEEGKAGLWLDVARALQASGQLGDALQALEAGLQIDQTLLEGWVLFAEIAHTLGSAEIAREAASVARQLAPDDTRVLAFL